MTPLLSILIPTVHGRERSFIRLFNKITGSNYDTSDWQDTRPDYYGETYVHNSKIHILWHKDNKQKTIGEKREGLYQLAIGKYSWQIDDDDDISEDALKFIMVGMLAKADCITFREKCIINGNYYSSNHSLIYTKWQDKYDGFDFVRTPFYKDVIKTEIAKSIPFPKIRWNEDEQWSMAIYPHLKNEYHIDKELYIYQHNSKSEDHNERYGIK